MVILSLLLTVLTLVVSLGYLFIKKRYSYWTNANIPNIKGKFPFGSLQGVGRKMHSSQLFKKYYNELKNSGSLFAGIYFFINPVVLALDLEFVKNILVRDFQHFYDRGVYYNERDDPLSAHLFSLEGTKWRSLRAKLTPTFTSGKMKMMFPTIINVADEFIKCLDASIAIENVIEMKDILSRFTTDVIGTCAFGLDCNSLKDPDAKFREMGKKVFDVQRNKPIKQLFMASFREFSRFLKIKAIHDDVSDFFMGAVKDTIEYREKNNIERNDFMNLLIQLKNKSSLKDDPDHMVGSVTIEEIAAQAFVFFLAGFETSSTTMSYSLYELSLHQDIQERARKSVQDVIQRHGGKMTYDAIMEMTYIDQIINETLRKYPPAASLIRMVTKEYKVPDINCILPKGMIVIIPVYAIQHDPEIYPDPEKFDPERFSEEVTKTRNPYAFIPFGEGPRICIGVRFGMMQARIGLATLLLNYKFSTCSKSIIPLDFSTKHAILTPVGGLWLNVDKITQ